VLLGAGVLSVVALLSIVCGVFGALAWWLFCFFLFGFVRLIKKANVPPNALAIFLQLLFVRLL
jgi:hypothetical protein